MSVQDVDVREVCTTKSERASISVLIDTHQLCGHAGVECLAFVADSIRSVLHLVCAGSFTGFTLSMKEQTMRFCYRHDMCQTILS